MLAHLYKLLWDRSNGQQRQLTPMGVPTCRTSVFFPPNPEWFQPFFISFLVHFYSFQVGGKNDRKMNWKFV